MIQESVQKMHLKNTVIANFFAGGACGGTDVFFALYVGPSMNPTLRGPEVIEVKPYSNRLVQVGDVVFFQPEEDYFVVHRVVRVSTQGIHTLGDNNVMNDSWFLKPPDILGQVVAAWRRQKRQVIFGGWKGCLIGRILRWRRVLERNASLLLSPIYHALARLAVLTHLLPNRFKPRVVDFRENEGGQLRLLMCGRVIGQCDSQLGRWVIQRPFRLFVDEKVLPNVYINESLSSRKERI